LGLFLQTKEGGEEQSTGGYSSQPFRNDLKNLALDWLADLLPTTRTDMAAPNRASAGCPIQRIFTHSWSILID